MTYLRILLLILLVGCMEFPTESTIDGDYNGKWIGHNESNTIWLQLNIRQEISSTHGDKEIVTNGLLLWMDIYWEVSFSHSNMIEGLLAGQLVLDNAQSDHTDFLMGFLTKELSDSLWILHVQGSVNDYIYMQQGTWKFP